MLIFSLVMVIYLAYGQPQRILGGTRTLAEPIKTESCRYVMRAEPYDVPDNVARESFADSLLKILEANQQICSHTVLGRGQDQITPAMHELRVADLAERIRFRNKLALVPKR